MPMRSASGGRRNNAEIAFYDKALKALEKVPQKDLNVYFDYRLYAPDTPGWVLETSYDLLSYNYIQEHAYDVLLLQQQRIADYLDPSAAGIDAQQFANSQAFYADAQRGELQSYRLLYRDQNRAGVYPGRHQQRYSSVANL